MQAHPAIVHAIQKHEGDSATVHFYTSEPFVRSSAGKAYFTKIGNPAEKEQFVGEAESLKAMHTAAPGLAPQLIECGIIDNHLAEHKSEVGKPYFVSEYKSMTALTDASAKRLAERIVTEMHQFKSTMGFGFGVPTFCGKTKQDNGWHNSWQDCFDSLLGGLLDKLEARGGFDNLCEKGKQVRQK